MAAVQVNQARSIGVSQKANLFENGASYNAIRFDHCSAELGGRRW